jgi:hypothetical protein
MERIAKSQIDQAIEALGNLPAPADREISKFEAVKMLAHVIARLRKRGYSLDSIVRFLADQQISINVATLKTYLHRLKKERARQAEVPSHAHEQRMKQPNPKTMTATVRTLPPTMSTAMRRPAGPYGAPLPREDSEEI